MASDEGLLGDAVEALGKAHGGLAPCAGGHIPQLRCQALARHLSLPHQLGRQLQSQGQPLLQQFSKTKHMLMHRGCISNARCCMQDLVDSEQPGQQK